MGNSRVGGLQQDPKDLSEALRRVGLHCAGETTRLGGEGRSDEGGSRRAAGRKASTQIAETTIGMKGITRDGRGTNKKADEAQNDRDNRGRSEEGQEAKTEHK